MIKNIVFDIGRVLLGFEWDEYMNDLFGDRIAEGSDEYVKDIVTGATFRSGIWDELDIGILTADEVLGKFVAKAPQYEAEIKEAFGRVGECTTHCDYSIPWIEEIKSLGYNVYYLSNYSEYVRSVSQHALDFLPHTDGGVFSYEVKSVKPSRRIYEDLFERYSLKPSECIFIDDNRANIEAGKALGMQGIVFENYKQAYEELNGWLK